MKRMFNPVVDGSKLVSISVLKERGGFQQLSQKKIDAKLDFAETAMNDILGWYGYGDSMDHRIDIAPPPPPPPGNESTNHQRSNGSTNKDPSSSSSSSSSSTATAAVVASKSKHNSKTQQHKPRQFNMLQHNSSELSDTIASAAAVVASGVASPASSSSLGKAGHNNKATTNSGDGRPGSSSNNNNNNTTNSSSSGSNTRNGVNLHHHGESSTSEKDSSRESSKSPLLVKMLDKQEPICQWCRRGVPPGQSGILGTTEGTIFCSESCFSQSRRASFKRAKTCDWCRHVRHAVSYVDFQDGVTQLQFCSDKCLNQYKMQIFCNETQAHLDLNPHLKEKSASTGSLITPDLWLKNCKSRSASPGSDRSESVSPALSVTMRPSPEPSPVMQSPPPPKKPMISVAPASKLLSKNIQPPTARIAVKTNRKRRPGLRPIQHGVLQNRRNSNHKLDYTQTNNNNNNSNVLNNNLTSTSSSMLSKPATVTSGGVQDLRAGMPMPHPLTPTKFENRESPSTPRPPPLNIPHQFLQLPPNPGMRPPFFPMNPMFRFGSPPNQPSMPPPPPVGTPLPNLDPSSNRQPHSMLGFPVPPVTILVPCPIVIPLPIPIPIPIPLIDFLKATNPKSPKVETSVDQSSDHNPAESQPTDTREDISDPEDCPLDFTTVSHDQRRQQEQEFTTTSRRSSYSLEAVTARDEPDRSPEHKLPKFKITRLNLRRIEEVVTDGVGDVKTDAGIVVREQRSPEEEEADHCREMVERSRPLRKRKRVVGHHEEMAAREEDSGGAKG